MTSHDHGKGEDRYKEYSRPYAWETNSVPIPAIGDHTSCVLCNLRRNLVRVLTENQFHLLHIFSFSASHIMVIVSLT